MEEKSWQEKLGEAMDVRKPEWCIDFAHPTDLRDYALQRISGKTLRDRTTDRLHDILQAAVAAGLCTFTKGN